MEHKIADKREKLCTRYIVQNALLQLVQNKILNI